MKNIFRQTSWSNNNLGSITQAGLVNNLNDAMVWGVLPVLLANRGYSLAQIGLITAIYPAVWGLGQLVTGKLADIYCKRDLLFWGMLCQGVAILFVIFSANVTHYLIVSVVLGLGTAVVYPTFLSGIAETSHPRQRAQSIGIFRFWRDLGYVIGALVAGILTDIFSIGFSVAGIGLLTIVSAFIILYRMNCHPASKRIWIAISSRA